MLRGLGVKSEVFLARAARATLYVMVFAMPLQAVMVIPGTGITVAKLGGLALIACVVLRRLSMGRPCLPWTGMEIPIALFAAVCLASSYDSLDPAASIAALKTLCLYMVLFYAVAEAAADDEVQRRIVLVFVTAAALSGLGAVSVGVVPGVRPVVELLVPQQEVRRVAFGLPDANEQALFFVVALVFLAFTPSLWTKSARRLLSLAALFAILAGLALTLSRMGWLCAAAIGFARALASPRRGRFVLIGAGIIALVVLAIVLTAPRFFADVQRRFAAGLTLGDTSWTHRFSQFVAAANASWDRPVLGHGLGTEPLVRQKFEYPRGMETGAMLHSVPLIVLLELGWLGVMAYYGLWSAALVRLWESRQTASTDFRRGLALSYTAVLILILATTVVMPFLYRSSFVVLAGCAFGATPPLFLRKPPV